jgi:putative transposase
MEASMARLARVVIPGLPHHVTQRGNRCEAVFFGDDDYAAYLDLIGQAVRRAGTEVWAYCLMPNHVHFIMAPAHEDGLRAAFAEAHRRYTARINARLRQTGHLWQGRFGSVVMDERHLLAAARYVAMNPVKAGLVAAPQDWPWSSARAHLAGRDDGLVTVAPLQQRVGDFAALLEGVDKSIAAEVFERASCIGRPLGAAAWQAEIERLAGRTLAPRKRGPKPKRRADGGEINLFSKLSP